MKVKVLNIVETIPTLLLSAVMKIKTQHTTKTAIKNKIDLVESKPNKISLLSGKKPPLKSELLEQVKALQKENDKLKTTEVKNISTIKNLEEQVCMLKNPTQKMSSTGSQTYAKEIKICCNVCIYVATCEEELNWHMGYEHDKTDDSYFDKDFYCDICSRWFEKEDEMKKHRIDHQKPPVVNTQSDTLNCNFCDETFQTKHLLMHHKKKAHGEKVTNCWKFVSGHCDYGDENCWFSHGRSVENHEKEPFRCRTCAKVFMIQSECLKHRKKEHSHLVPLCMHEKGGTCKFGHLNCWFLHENENETNKNEHRVKGLETNGND